MQRDYARAVVLAKRSLKTSQVVLANCNVSINVCELVFTPSLRGEGWGEAECSNL